MNWGSASEFFAMGGHGFYVWGSFAVTALCMTLEPLSLLARRKKALERVKLERVQREAAA